MRSWLACGVGTRKSPSRGPHLHHTMQVCVLIVRLIGLYLLLSNLAALLQLLRMKSHIGAAALSSALSGDVIVIASIGALLALVATLFAGRLVLLLTFDANDSSSADRGDLIERLLKK